MSERLQHDAISSRWSARRGRGRGARILSGCATGTGGAAEAVGRVIVIGGGYGGATAAKYIRHVERAPHRSGPDRAQRAVRLLPALQPRARRLAQIESLTVGYDKLREYGVQVMRDEVTASTSSASACSSSGEDLPYDRLIVAPGIDFIYDQIPGLNRREAQKRVLHAWKAGPQTVALRKQLEAMRDGGVYVLSISRGAVPLPARPVRARLPGRGLLQAGEAEVEDARARCQPGHRVEEGPVPRRVERAVQGDHRVPSQQEAKDVDVKGMTVKTEFDAFKGDVLNVVPPQRAGDRAQAKLITANDRWCGVNWQTMESVAVPGRPRARRRDAVGAGDAQVGAAWRTSTPRSPQRPIVALMTGAAGEPCADDHQHLLQLRDATAGDARRRRCTADAAQKTPWPGRGGWRGVRNGTSWRSPTPTTGPGTSGPTRWAESGPERRPRGKNAERAPATAGASFFRLRSSSAFSPCRCCRSRRRRARSRRTRRRR